MSVIRSFLATLGLDTDTASFARGDAALNELRSALAGVAAAASRLGEAIGSGKAGGGGVFGGFKDGFDKVMTWIDRGRSVGGWFADLVSGAENSRIKLAAMAQGLGADGLVQGQEGWNDALQLSDGLLAKMRADVAALPGEFKDLENVMFGVFSGGVGAGKTTDEIEQFASQMMATTQMLGITSEQAGRELTQLFEGRAGTQNTVFMRLKPYMDNVDAKTFNQLTDEQRFARLSDAIGKFGPAIQEFSNSWDAVSSATSDYGKEVAKSFATPVFDAIKDILKEINGWYERNRDSVKRIATLIGGALATSLRMVWGLLKFVADNWRVLAAVLGVVGVAILLNTVQTMGLAAAYQAAKASAVGAALASAAAWVAAALPIIAIAAGVLILILILEDLWTSMTGGQGLILDISRMWNDFLKRWVETPSDSGFVAGLKDGIRYLLHLNDSMSTAILAWREQWMLWGDWVSAKIEEINQALTGKFREGFAQLTGFLGIEGQGAPAAPAAPSAPLAGMNMVSAPATVQMIINAAVGQDPTAIGTAAADQIGDSLGGHIQVAAAALPGG